MIIDMVKKHFYHPHEFGIFDAFTKYGHALSFRQKNLVNGSEKEAVPAQCIYAIIISIDIVLNYGFSGISIEILKGFRGPRKVNAVPSLPAGALEHDRKALHIVDILINVRLRYAKLVSEGTGAYFVIQEPDLGRIVERDYDPRELVPVGREHILEENRDDHPGTGPLDGSLQGLQIPSFSLSCGRACYNLDIQTLTDKTFLYCLAGFPTRVGQYDIIFWHSAKIRKAPEPTIGSGAYILSLT